MMWARLPVSILLTAICCRYIAWKALYVGDEIVLKLYTLTRNLHSLKNYVIAIAISERLQLTLCNSRVKYNRNYM